MEFDGLKTLIILTETVAAVKDVSVEVNHVSK